MISAVVMAHPARAEHAEKLAAELKVPVVWDERGDVVDTARRALQAYDPAATHHLVLQDDSIVCRDLLAGLTAACEVAGPRRPVVPYFGTLGPGVDTIGRLAGRAVRAGAPWVEFTGPRWGVAVAHPVALLPEVLDRYQRINSRNDDARLNSCYRDMQVSCWYTMPSLVEHNNALPSLTKPGYSGKRRSAFQFIGADRSALDVEWSGPVIRK